MSILAASVASQFLSALEDSDGSDRDFVSQIINLISTTGKWSPNRTGVLVDFCREGVVEGRGNFGTFEEFCKIRLGLPQEDLSIWSDNYFDFLSLWVIVESTIDSNNFDDKQSSDTKTFFGRLRKLCNGLLPPELSQINLLSPTFELCAIEVSQAARLAGEGSEEWNELADVLGAGAETAKFSLGLLGQAVQSWVTDKLAVGHDGGARRISAALESLAAPQADRTTVMSQEIGWSQLGDATWPLSRMIGLKSVEENKKFVSVVESFLEGLGRRRQEEMSKMILEIEDKQTLVRDIDRQLKINQKQKIEFEIQAEAVAVESASNISSLENQILELRRSLKVANDSLRLETSRTNVDHRRPEGSMSRLSSASASFERQIRRPNWTIAKCLSFRILPTEPPPTALGRLPLSQTFEEEKLLISAKFSEETLHVETLLRDLEADRSRWDTQIDLTRPTLDRITINRFLLSCWKDNSTGVLEACKAFHHRMSSFGLRSASLWGGWTGMHIAVRQGHVRVVKVLLEAEGEDNSKGVGGLPMVCIPTTSGHTPLHLAVLSRTSTVLMNLLLDGAPSTAVTHLDNRGNSVLHLVSQLPEIEKLIREFVGNKLKNIFPFPNSAGQLPPAKEIPVGVKISFDDLAMTDNRPIAGLVVYKTSAHPGRKLAWGWTNIFSTFGSLVNQDPKKRKIFHDHVGVETNRSTWVDHLAENGDSTILQAAGVFSTEVLDVAGCSFSEGRETGEVGCMRRVFCVGGGRLLVAQWSDVDLVAPSLSSEVAAVSEICFLAGLPAVCILRIAGSDDLVLEASRRDEILVALKSKKQRHHSTSLNVVNTQDSVVPLFNRSCDCVAFVSCLDVREFALVKNFDFEVHQFLFLAPLAICVYQTAKGMSNHPEGVSLQQWRRVLLSISRQENKLGSLDLWGANGLTSAGPLISIEVENIKNLRPTNFPNRGDLSSGLTIELRVGSDPPTILVAADRPQWRDRLINQISRSRW